MTVSIDCARLASQAAGLLRIGRFAEAIETYRTLLAAAPDRPDDWYNLGYLHRAMRQFDEALSAYGEAIARGLRQPEEAYVNRAAILSDHLFRPDEAERELAAAVSLAPNFLIAWHNLGQLREDRNDREGARQAYQAAIALSPNDSRAHARVAALDVFEGRAAEAIERLRTPLQAAGDGPDAPELAFAQASALDAIGDYNAAFAGFERANVLGARYAQVSYNRAAQDRLIDDLIAAFPAAPQRGVPDPVTPDPVFICGMFRSGSTLCEQLLARHSAITAGGELEIIPAMAAGVLAPYPATMASLPASTFDRLHQSYLDELRALFPGAGLLTDKRPDNFLHIGLIKRLFPAARIIHTVRNPLDNILSIFFLYFADSVSYGARIDDILHYYRGYVRLMAHWRRLYPDIIEVDYDELVRAPEAATRSLLASLGLEWEDRCDPARSFSADVRTASAWQVRQPIHQRSSGRWQNYEKHISGLRAALK